MRVISASVKNDPALLLEVGEYAFPMLRCCVQNYFRTVSCRSFASA
jgi:hypothetical protein